MPAQVSDNQFSFVRTYKYYKKDTDNPFFIKYYGKDIEKESLDTNPKIQTNKTNNVVKIKFEEKIQIQQKNEKNFKEKQIFDKNDKLRESQMKQIQELRNFAKVDFKKLKKNQRKEFDRSQKLNSKQNGKDMNKGQQKGKKQQRNNQQNKGNNSYKDLDCNIPTGLNKIRSRSTEALKPKQFKNKQSFNKEKDDRRWNAKVLYDEYLQIQEIQQSRRKGQKKYFKGTVQFIQRIKTFAKIKTNEIDGNLLAEGKNRNRCIHQDQVYFQIIEQANQKTYCKIVNIITPDQKRQIVGRIDFLEHKRMYYITPNNQRFIAMNVRMNEIQKQWLKEINIKYFLVELHSWKRDSQYPQCTVISEYGKFGDIDIEANALLKTHNVYQKEYTQSQIQSGLKKFIDQANVDGEYKISKQQIAKRCDLRNHRIFTIDPLTARDFDDALEITKMSQQQLKRLNLPCTSQVYQIGVHIADASFFVQQGSIIDQQAKKRTTSVYLVHKVLPMLPRVLCQTMCSLNPGLERLTLSVWFYIDIEGNILPGVRYDRTVIESKARFTYEQAQLIIQDKITGQKDFDIGFGCTDQKYIKDIFNDIKTMNVIALKLRKNRIDGGSLIFQTPKKSFSLNQEHFPISYQIKNRIESNFLVEEYMLLANQKVGQILVDFTRAQALLRRHRFPGEKKITTFQAFMKKIGHPMKIQKNTKIQQEINKILGDPALKQAVKQIIKHEMIYLLEQAQYFVVGDTQQKDWLHYALNMAVYTHFTSPIRRYPDIIVHRQLISIIQANKINQKVILSNQQILKSLVQRCNKNKVSAKKVSSGCQKIFLCLYLKDKPVFTPAILVAVQDWGFKISVPKYDCRVVLKIKDFKNMKVLTFEKKQDDKKYMQIQVTDGDFSTKIILRELQQIPIRLGATQTFPLDYKVSFAFPHPKKIGQKLIIG